METETPKTLCYKLIDTYDTSVLDNKNITKELRDVFEKEAVINACGINSVLMKLIRNNHTYYRFALSYKLFLYMDLCYQF